MTGRQIKLPAGYETNNPKILERVKKDLAGDAEFHYLFMGECGCGKTYLANAIAQAYGDTKVVAAIEIYRKYLIAQNINTSDQGNEIRKSLQCLRTRPGNLLIFDDLGAEAPKTAASKSFIEEILEDRYNWIQKNLAGSTIITTNYSAKDLAMQYGDRIVDRLQEKFIIMKFHDKSFRELRIRIIEG